MLCSDKVYFTVSLCDLWKYLPILANVILVKNIYNINTFVESNLHGMFTYSYNSISVMNGGWNNVIQCMYVFFEKIVHKKYAEDPSKHRLNGNTCENLHISRINVW